MQRTELISKNIPPPQKKKEEEEEEEDNDNDNDNVNCLSQPFLFKTSMLIF